MSNKLIVRNPQDAVDGDLQVIGPIVKDPEGNVHISEEAFNLLANTGELHFRTGQTVGDIPNPVRIGLESDHGVLLLFASDKDRNYFISKLTEG